MTLAHRTTTLCLYDRARPPASTRCLIASSSAVTFDGPAVADEAILPAFSTLQCKVDGRVALESRINWLASPARIVAERVKSMSL